MQHYKRREQGTFPYFKLATWDPRSLTYRDGKQALPSEQAAREAARKPGRYRVSVVRETGREDLEPFEV